MTHSFPLHTSYHECPKCHKILESRKDYRYFLGKWVKELNCSRCGHNFTEFAKKNPPIGPLFGDSPKPEFDWK